MNKETWIRHAEEVTGMIRPSQDFTASPEQWKAAVKTHQTECPSCAICKARVKAKRANESKRVHDDVMCSIGLVKVKGALGGVYWE